MPKPYDVMMAGHLCIDIIPRFPDSGKKCIGELMRPGTLVNIEEATISTGGPVSNTGLCMKGLGNEVCFCSRIGDDTFGKLTIDILNKSGNADGMHIVEGAVSSYTLVIAPPNIDRIFLHHPGTNNSFVPEDVDPDLLAQCRHFHSGYPPLMIQMYENDGANLEEVFRAAKAAGVTTSCDMTLPDSNSPSGKIDWRTILSRILPHMDLYLPSVEETHYMLEAEACLAMKKTHDNADLIDYYTPDDYTRLAEACIELGAKIVALKTGHRGFYIKTALKDVLAQLEWATPELLENWSDRELWQQAFQVETFGSATGSGDSAIAGFLSAYLRGLTLEEALQYAVTCGYQNVCELDAVSGIRSWEETTALLNADMPFIDAKIDAADWQPSKTRGQWERISS